jgi:molecular chaperone DnaK
VSAKDLGTGKEQSIRITASSGLSEEEIQKMTKDADAHAAEDKTKRLLVEKRNEADTLIYTVEKSLKDHGDKISGDEKQKITDALERCKKLKDTSNDPEELQKAIEELSSASHKLAEHIYKTASAGAQQTGGETPSEETPRKEKEDVVEAEFEEVDKNKKDS